MTVLIVGAGQAGAQAAVSLRQAGYDGRVLLVGDEPQLPYQRPPLSKAFLTGKVERAGIVLRNEATYADQRIELLSGQRVLAVDRARRQARLSAGAEVDYAHLVFATGARNRPLAVEGAELDGVLHLRTIDEASALRERMAGVRSAVVVGGGFIGLEFAAVARMRGIEVTVVELAPRLMARAVTPQVSDWFTARHRAAGSRILVNAAVARIEGQGGRVAGVVLGDGQRLAADLVVAGVGVLPNVELAAASGLEVCNGIVVDGLLRTADPAVSALGDCASFPCAFADGHVRLESVQNALDQARCVAARIAGQPATYAALPWFWSDQFDAKLQIAGLIHAPDRTVLLGRPEEGAFSVFAFREGRWLGVESVNRPGDHMTARKLLAARTPLAAEAVAAAGFDLKAFAATL